MNKSVIITLAILILLVAILCLKISLVEYFTDDLNSYLKKIKKDYGINIDLKELEKKCPDELKAATNDNAVKNIMKGIMSNDVSKISISLLSNMPKSLENLQICVTKHNLI